MRSTLSALLGVTLTAGCAGDVAAPRARFIEITLAPTSVNAGQIGRATLVAVGDATEIAVWVSGVPPALVSRPVHLYTFLYRGSCANPGAEPAYSLTKHVLAQSPASSAIVPLSGPFSVTNLAPAPLDAIARGPFALRVLTAPADGNREIFCGDVGP
jgi:hypothetical protein